jgi:hypothetical protein
VLLIKPRLILPMTALLMKPASERIPGESTGFVSRCMLPCLSAGGQPPGDHGGSGSGRPAQVVFALPGVRILQRDREAGYAASCFVP